MKITRNTLRADGLTVGQSMDRDAAELRSLGFDAKDGQPTFGELSAERREKAEQFERDMRNAVLHALDAFMSERGACADSGWRDEDLPALFSALDAHAEKLFNRAQF